MLGFEWAPPKYPQDASATPDCAFTHVLPEHSYVWRREGVQVSTKLRGCRQVIHEGGQKVGLIHTAALVAHSPCSPQWHLNCHSTDTLLGHGGQPADGPKGLWPCLGLGLGLREAASRRRLDGLRGEERTNETRSDAERRGAKQGRWAQPVRRPAQDWSGAARAARPGGSRLAPGLAGAAPPSSPTFTTPNDRFWSITFAPIWRSIDPPPIFFTFENWR